MPPFTTVDHTTCRAQTNPLGVKGIGEAGTTGAPPAVMNAIVDALRPYRRARQLDMPATPMRVWRAIEAAKAPQP